MGGLPWASAAKFEMPGVSLWTVEVLEKLADKNGPGRNDLHFALLHELVDVGSLG